MKKKDLACRAKCPNADQKYEYEKCLEQAQEIAQRVSKGTLPPRDAWLGLKTRVIPKICYPFGITRFSTKQLKKLVQSSTTSLFNKLDSIETLQE
jgi:hypothetical protein